MLNGIKLLSGPDTDDDSLLLHNVFTGVKQNKRFTQLFLPLRALFKFKTPVFVQVKP